MICYNLANPIQSLKDAVYIDWWLILGLYTRVLGPTDEVIHCGFQIGL